MTCVLRVNKVNGLDASLDWLRVDICLRTFISARLVTWPTVVAIKKRQWLHIPFMHSASQLFTYLFQILA